LWWVAARVAVALSVSLVTAKDAPSTLAAAGPAGVLVV
jgi:hypothetical protein